MTLLVNYSDSFKRFQEACYNETVWTRSSPAFWLCETGLSQEIHPLREFIENIPIPSKETWITNKYFLPPTTNEWTRRYKCGCLCSLLFTIKKRQPSVLQAITGCPKITHIFSFKIAWPLTFWWIWVIRLNRVIILCVISFKYSIRYTVIIIAYRKYFKRLLTVVTLTGVAYPLKNWA